MMCLSTKLMFKQVRENIVTVKVNVYVILYMLI